jgi:hypothetical protein
VPYPCSLNVPSLQDAGPMGDQNPMAYVHKGGVRILSYLYHLCKHPEHFPCDALLPQVPQQTFPPNCIIGLGNVYE